MLNAHTFAVNNITKLEWSYQEMTLYMQYIFGVHNVHIGMENIGMKRKKKLS